MASNSELSLQSAVSAVERAIARLDASADVALVERASSASASARETAQQEIVESWQQHSASLESALAVVQQENEFLREEYARVNEQLAALQQDYFTLQQEAGDTVARIDATVKQLDLILEH